eukprot:m.200368 g.200368  ORF g.200368 m.200368 type:complete len:188 (+) comp53817_c0_seq1:1914-2477(+)
MRDSFTLVHTLAPITATSALVGLAGGLVAFKFRKPILRNSAMFSAYGAAVSSVFFVSREHYIQNKGWSDPTSSLTAGVLASVVLSVLRGSSVSRFPVYCVAGAVLGSAGGLAQERLGRWKAERVFARQNEGSDTTPQELSKPHVLPAWFPLSNAPDAEKEALEKQIEVLSKRIDALDHRIREAGDSK